MSIYQGIKICKSYLSSTRELKMEGNRVYGKYGLIRK
jgi:hypothetical protein